MENMKIWNQVSTPPPNVLKQIKGGRLKGMTDISPQWRYQVLTEIYGPCGQGWNYKVVRLWLEPGTEGQVFAFAEILLWAGESKDIPGIGGSMLLVKEKGGLHHNDEAFKMAVTDALSTACKLLGVGADIYLNKYDGSKYKQEQPPPTNFVVQEYQKKIAMLKDPAGFDSLLLKLLDVSDQTAVKIIKMTLQSHAKKIGVIYDVQTKKFQFKPKNDLGFLLTELGKIETKKNLIKFEKAFDPQISGLDDNAKKLYSSESATRMALIQSKTNE